MSGMLELELVTELPDVVLLFMFDLSQSMEDLDQQGASVNILNNKPGYTYVIGFVIYAQAN
jgi:hypothetical protein